MNETTTTTRRALPRFEGASRRRAEDFVRPLPDRIFDAMKDTPQAARHAELARHFEAAREKAVTTASEFQKVKADDEKRAATALASGRPRPAPRSEKIELDLRQVREDVSLLAEMLRTSADELLVAAIDFLPDAYAQAEREVEEAIAEVSRLLEATREALEGADRAAGEVGWTGTLIRSGVCWPWSDATRATALPLTRQAVATAIGGLQEDLIRREENRESAAREKDADAQKRLPVGAQIWQEGREFRVTEDGELKEVPR